MGNNFIKYSHNLTSLARQNRNNSTKAELLLWNMVLRGKKTGFKFVRQKPIGKYILDFYCSELLICLEVDGNTHIDSYEQDKKRSNYLNSNRITIIRYTNEEIFTSLEVIYYTLCQKLEQRKNELRPSC